MRVWACVESIRLFSLYWNYSTIYEAADLGHFFIWLYSIPLCHCSLEMLHSLRLGLIFHTQFACALRDYGGA